MKTGGKKYGGLSFFLARISKFFNAVFSGQARLALKMLGRYLMLPAMAFAIVMLLASQDMALRVLSLVCLIFMEQIRDMWTFRDIEDARKNS